MKYKVDDTQLSAVADAIRTKAGTSDLLEFPDDFVSNVNNITPSIISSNDTAQYKFPQAYTVYYTSPVTVYCNGYSGNVSPITSASWSSSFTGMNNLQIYTSHTGLEIAVKIVLPSSVSVTIPKNVILTINFKRYTASI